VFIDAINFKTPPAKCSPDLPYYTWSAITYEKQDDGSNPRFSRITYGGRTTKEAVDASGGVSIDSLK